MRNKRGNVLVIFLAVALVVSVSAAGYLFWQNRQLQNQAVKTTSPVQNPTPVPTIAPTANWKTYKTSQYEIKYPPDWKLSLTPLEGESLFKIIPNSNVDDNFYPGLFVEFKSINNTSLETQKNIYERMNLIKNGVFFKNITAVKYTGASSTKNVNGRIVPGVIQQIFILLEHSGYIYTFGYSYEESAINKKQEDLFDQILSTFKFLDQVEQSPLASPTANPAKNLNYLLPTGWKTVQDKTGTFEIGYNPETDLIFGPSSINNLNVGLTKVGQYGGSSYNLTIKPYDGGSRHNFILGPSGIQEQDKMADYHEKNYTYNGWSCLVLYGISISQWPSTQGMCAIDSKQAFAFGMWKDEAATKQIIQTIKLLK